MSLGISSPAQQWDWATRFTGDSSEARFLQADAASNLYIAGTFNGTNFFGTNQVISAGTSDVFVVSLKADGQFRWAYTAGGTNQDTITGFAVLPDGTAFVCGAFATNAAPGEASTNLLLARLDGGGVSWARPVGNARWGVLTVDVHTNLWIVSEENWIVLARKYSVSGDLLHTTQLGNGAFGPTTVAVRRDGRIVVGGRFTGALDLRGVQISSDTGLYWPFVAEFLADGSARWAYPLSQYNSSAAQDLAFTSQGEVLSLFVWNTGLPQGYTTIVKHRDDGSVAWRTDLTGGWKSTFLGQTIRVDGNGCIHLAGGVLERFGSNCDGGCKGYRSAAWIAVFSPDGIKKSQQFIVSPEYYVKNSANALLVDSQGDTWIAGVTGGEPRFGTNALVGAAYASTAFVARRATVVPSLRWGFSGTNLELEWPRTALPFALQRGSGFSSNDWSDVTIPPLAQGDSRKVALSRTADHEFFRLRQTNEPPFNRKPVVNMSTFPQFLGRAPVFITVSNTIARLELLAGAADDDDDSLWFRWYFAGNSEPETNGIRVYASLSSFRAMTYYYAFWSPTNLALPPGGYDVRVTASDAFATVSSSARFEVITDEAALDQMMTALQRAANMQDVMTLLPVLEAARDAAARADYPTAAAHLDDFMMSLEAAQSLEQSDKNMLSSAANYVRSVLPMTR